MKIKNLALCAIATAVLMSCGSSSDADKNADSLNATPVKYTVVAKDSKVTWEGHTSGVSVYGHKGEVSLTEGTLEVAGEAVISGSFTVDMKSILPLDSAYSPEHPKEDLVKHLISPDFFLVDSFPTASFVIKSVENGKIVGDLTVKGITKEETLQNVKVVTNENGITATAKLVFDRQKYGVSWVHFVKDVLLADEITVEIALVATK